MGGSRRSSVHSIHFEFVCSFDGIRTVHPPAPAANFLPTWLRRASPVVPPVDSTIVYKSRLRSTVKRCIGIRDIMSVGWIIPLWTDIVIKYNSSHGELSWVSDPGAPGLSSHPIEQVGDGPIADIIYPYSRILKLSNPWRIFAPSGWSTIMSDPWYHRDNEDFRILAGLVDHDSFHGANIFLAWRKFGRGEALIPRGTPLCQIIPIERADFSMSIRNATKEDITKEAAEAYETSGIVRRYHKKYWKKKRVK